MKTLIIICLLMASCSKSNCYECREKKTNYSICEDSEDMQYENIRKGFSKIVTYTKKPLVIGNYYPILTSTNIVMDCKAK